MKVLLVNPFLAHPVFEFPDEDGRHFIEAEDFGFFPPLGILYIAAYIEEHAPSHEVKVLDCVAEKMTHEQLGEFCQNWQPDIVGISSYSTTLYDVCLAARTVRQASPKAHINLGGHHPIAFPYEAAQLPEFDSIVVGEGEVAFTELVNALSDNADFTEITGVYTKDTAEIHRQEVSNDPRFISNLTLPAAYIDDLEAIPAPSRKHIQHLNYFSVIGISNKLATIISSRGCPYKCTYCEVPYKRYRDRKVTSVVDEVEECLAMEYDEFHFYDDLFNITPEKLIAFCEELQKRNLNIAWDFRGRVNTVTRESLIAAKKSGCRLASFGVETGTNEGLKAIRKGTTIQQVQNVFGWCRELGILTVADFMIGFPFEKSEADILTSLDFMHKLDPDYAQLSILMVLPNTEIYREAEERGLVDFQRWKDFINKPYSGFHVDHWTEHLSLNDLFHIKKAATRKFYFRPRYILRSLLKLTSFHEFKTKLKGCLALLR